MNNPRLFEDSFRISRPRRAGSRSILMHAQSIYEQAAGGESHALDHLQTYIGRGPWIPRVITRAAMTSAGGSRASSNRAVNYMMLLLMDRLLLANNVETVRSLAKFGTACQLPRSDRVLRPRRGEPGAIATASMMCTLRVKSYSMLLSDDVKIVCTRPVCFVERRTQRQQ